MIGSNTTSMMVILPRDEWEEIKLKLDKLADMVVTRNNGDADSEWVESNVARKMLGVSPTTWQTLRDNRTIPFSQYGRKIYVKKGDLQAFLERNYITSK